MSLVILAAMLCAVTRYLTDVYLPRHGILASNIVGSFIAGIVLSLAMVFQLDDVVVHILLGGFAGSLTTYSTVAATAAEQHMQRSGRALHTWVAHVGLSIAACLCGMFLPILVFG